MKITKLQTKDSLYNLQKGDILLVEWKEGSDPYKKAGAITHHSIWGVQLKEVIVEEERNFYFSIPKYMQNRSVAKEVYLVTK